MSSVARDRGAAEPQQRDATELAELIRTGQTSALEAVDAAIAQAEKIDPIINALISRRFEKARGEAKALDADPTRKRTAPFAGVPFLVKDLAMLAGEPLTFGSRLFRDYRVSKNEPIVQAMLDSGLIAIGKSNTPEFGLIGTTEPLEFGATCNPWDLSLSPGGSSGGAAAAVAAGVVPFAHATDGGGSIRIPAAACGLFGLKLSRGRGLPPHRSAPGGLSTSFCVTRSVRDSARMLEVLDRRRVEEADDNDPGPAEIGYVDTPAVRPLRIALAMQSAQGNAPEPDVAEAVAAAARLCESLGHHVEEAAPQFDGAAAEPHFITLWSEIPLMVERQFMVARALGCGWKAWEWPSIDDALDPWTRGLAEWRRARDASAPDALEAARAFFRDVSRDYEAFFTDYDVVISPVMRRANFPLGEQAPTVPFETLLERASNNVGYTPLHNAIGAPAMSMPLGWTEDGLPIGVQFAARRHDERTLLSLALQLEEAAPWIERTPALSNTK